MGLCILLVGLPGPASAASLSKTWTPPFHGQANHGLVLGVAGCGHSKSNYSFNPQSGVARGYISAKARFPSSTICSWPYSNATAGFWGTLTTRNFTTTTGTHQMVASWTILYRVLLDPGVGSFQAASAGLDTWISVHDLTNGSYLPWQFPEWAVGWHATSASAVYAGSSNVSVFLNYSLLTAHTYQIIVGWDTTVFVWSQGAVASASLNLTGPSHFLKLDSISLT